MITNPLLLIAASTLFGITGFAGLLHLIPRLGPGGAQSGDQMEEARETGDAEQGRRRDEQQWVCYHTNSVQGVYDKGPSNRANLPLMQVRIRLAAPLLFTLLVLASSRALNHMDQPLALLLIVPGYVVQAWLFEAHRALGGTGYVVTMVGVSALVWTLILLGLWAVTAKVFRPRRGHGPA